MKCGKIVISALRGGSGKTIVSVGIIAALSKKKILVAPFKKGPDYIDAGWLALAAGRPCYNLDTFLLPEAEIISSFKAQTSPQTLAVVEGNRGLYDCIDIDGSTSTAELAKLINAPVILTLDCTKITRTMAAVISGLQQFDPKIRIGGVVLNRTAGPRHVGILTNSIEHHCGIPVLGALPKLKEDPFPERHMGLVPTPEHSWAHDSIDKTAQIATDNLDIDRIVHLAGQDMACDPGQYDSVMTDISRQTRRKAHDANQPTIGIIRDSAFQFYYPENIEALESSGANLLFISPLNGGTLPEIDSLYIGGGFPETHASALADNETFRFQLKSLALEGLPIYAECGGLMYLGNALVLDGKSYPMAGVLPVTFGFSKKPKGHGYTVLKVIKENPFYEVGTELKGHEFHYSTVDTWDGKADDLAFGMTRGGGIINNMDGVCFKNVLATYTHIHSLGTPQWAPAMVKKAAEFRKKRLATTP